MVGTKFSGGKSPGNDDQGGFGDFDDLFGPGTGGNGQQQPVASGTESDAKRFLLWPDGIETEEGTIDPGLDTLALLAANEVAKNGTTPLWKDKRFTDRYDVDTLIFLGEGGMGAVHSAVDKKTGRRVAIKEVKQEYMQYEPQTRGFKEVEAVNRFLDEISTMRRLNHPNIVRIYDDARYFVNSTPIIMFATELVEGKTLETDYWDRRDRGQQYTLHEVLSIAEQAASAMAYAHKEGIIHRDLKPQNIMIRNTSKGLETKIMDFGIAKRPEETGRMSHTVMTQDTGTERGLPGTRHYMAPEAYEKGITSVRTDIFSFGATLYTILTGKHVHLEEQEGSYDAHDVVKRGGERFAELPGIKDMLLKMLAYDPEDRYESMDAVLEDITHLRTRKFGDPDQKYTEIVALLKKDTPDYVVVRGLLEDAFDNIRTLDMVKRQELQHEFEIMVDLADVYTRFAADKMQTPQSRAVFAAQSNDIIRYARQQAGTRTKGSVYELLPESHLDTLMARNIGVLRDLGFAEKHVELPEGYGRLCPVPRLPRHAHREHLIVADEPSYPVIFTTTPSTGTTPGSTTYASAQHPLNHVFMWNPSVKKGA